jgi:hypothetical protein
MQALTEAHRVIRPRLPDAHRTSETALLATARQMRLRPGHGAGPVPRTVESVDLLGVGRFSAGRSSAHDDGVDLHELAGVPE